MNLLSTASNDFGFTVSTKKTEVMHQPALAVLYTGPNIIVGGQKLTVADKFVYPGSTPSRSATIEEEVTHRIALKGAAFGRLHTSVFDRRSRDQFADQTQGVPCSCSAFLAVRL